MRDALNAKPFKHEMQVIENCFNVWRKALKSFLMRGERLCVRFECEGQGIEIGFNVICKSLKTFLT